MGDENKQLHVGKVLRLDRVGLGVIVSDSTDAESSEKEFPFTFDKIEGYKGESLNGLGLSEGAVVNFTLDAEDRVCTVTPERLPQAKKPLRFGLDKVFSLSDKVF
jgi:hypothetical protein